ncbi:hypothetical protein HPB48_004505 [Haemaphysalis longicornis]|uniref:Uncharacterized protein n=1 Tax=Haemaphysalis longicornis TaxID=44386 RepID=A0A9J6GX22_HAELO|nr:hypothetical protein HPB48_004505 [Haemaphysalis longicornis]
MSIECCASKNRLGKTNDGKDVERSRIGDHKTSKALQWKRRAFRPEYLSEKRPMTLVSKRGWRLREKSRRELYQQSRRRGRGSSPLQQLKRCDWTVASAAERTPLKAHRSSPRGSRLRAVA